LNGRQRRSTTQADALWAASWQQSIKHFRYRSNGCAAIESAFDGKDSVGLAPASAISRHASDGTMAQSVRRGRKPMPFP